MSLEETWQWHLHALWASQAVEAHHQEPELSITSTSTSTTQMDYFLSQPDIQEHL